MAQFTMWLVWPETADDAPQSGPLPLIAQNREDALAETGLVLARLPSHQRPSGYRVYDDVTGNLVGEWDIRN